MRNLNPISSHMPQWTPLLPTIPGEPEFFLTIPSEPHFFPQSSVDPTSSHSSWWTPLLPTVPSEPHLYGASSSSPLVFMLGFQTLSLSRLISSLVLSCSVAADGRKGAPVVCTAWGALSHSACIAWLILQLSQPDLPFSLITRDLEAGSPVQEPGCMTPSGTATVSVFALSHSERGQEEGESGGQGAHAPSLHEFFWQVDGQSQVTWPPVTARESGEVIVFYWVCGYPVLLTEWMGRMSGEGHPAASTSVVMNAGCWVLLHWLDYDMCLTHLRPSVALRNVGLVMGPMVGLSEGLN